MDILTGYKKIKRYVKESAGYKLISQWTSSQTVAMNDGTTLEDKITSTEENISEIRSSVENKVDKIPGKGLSANDYTAAEKNKLNGIASGAEVNVQADWNATDSSSDAFIKNKPVSMSANGGNADTVDNKHASDFLASTTKYAASDSVGGAAEIAKRIPVDPTTTPTAVGSIWITT